MPCSASASGACRLGPCAGEVVHSRPSITVVPSTIVCKSRVLAHHRHISRQWRCSPACIDLTIILASPQIPESDCCSLDSLGHVTAQLVQQAQCISGVPRGRRPSSFFPSSRSGESADETTRVDLIFRTACAESLPGLFPPLSRSPFAASGIARRRISCRGFQGSHPCYVHEQAASIARLTRTLFFTIRVLLPLFHFRSLELRQFRKHFDYSSHVQTLFCFEGSGWQGRQTLQEDLS